MYARPRAAKHNYILSAFIEFHPIIAKVIYRITKCTARDCIYERKTRCLVLTFYVKTCARDILYKPCGNLLHKVNPETVRYTVRTAGGKKKLIGQYKEARTPYACHIVACDAERGVCFRFKGLKGLSRAQYNEQDV